MASAALASGSSILSLVIARIRCLCLPNEKTGKCTCMSGCTDQSLRSDKEHELLIREVDLGGGRKMVVVADGLAPEDEEAEDTGGTAGC